MKFGRYDIQLIETGRLRLDGGAMFGVVPKPLWAKHNQTDELNRIAMTMRALVLRDGTRTILVDAGAGEKDNEKFRSIYAIDYSEFSLQRGLNSLGITAEQVTDVILTHVHFDHAGGCVRNVDGRLEPVFPHARHYVQKRHWEWAMHPSDKDRASFLPDNYLPLRDADILTFLEGETELFDGLYLHVVDGHTFGQQLVRIDGGGASLLYAADLVPMSSHVPVPWIMGYDLQPLVTLREKIHMLDRAAREGDILVFEHDTLVEAATIEKTDKGYAIRNRGALSDIVKGGG